jgi:uncharacterized Fe-S cluster protein YjdI
MDTTNFKKEYTNGEITVVWKPNNCIHSKICWQAATGLPNVFNPKVKKWINLDAASNEEIIAQIDKCPSGALSYVKIGEGQKNEESITECIIEPMTNGPLIVYGNILVKDKDGNETHKNKVTSFCRCGASHNKPYCDGTHTKIDFSG